MDHNSQEAHIFSPIENCPAIPEWWEKKSFYTFYQAGESQDGWILKIDEFITRINCNEKFPKVIKVGMEEICEFRGYNWIKLPITTEWKSGFYASEIMPQREHWHTSIFLQNHWIHIDYVSLAFGSCHCYGKEYRVFFDGQDLGRGGGYLGYMMAVFGGLRNYPLIVIADKYLIHINNILQRFGSRNSYGEIKPDGVLSIWQIA